MTCERVPDTELMLLMSCICCFTGPAHSPVGWKAESAILPDSSQLSVICYQHQLWSCYTSLIFSINYEPLNLSYLNVCNYKIDNLLQCLQTAPACQPLMLQTAIIKQLVKLQRSKTALIWISKVIWLNIYVCVNSHDLTTDQPHLTVYSTTSMLL